MGSAPCLRPQTDVLSRPLRGNSSTKHLFVWSGQDAGRLLYLGQNEWAHVNCCLWSAEVYEQNGALLQVHSAVSRGRHLVKPTVPSPLVLELSSAILSRPVSMSSAATAVDSRGPRWAAASPPARVTSTSCVLAPKAACSRRTGRCTAACTGTWSAQRYRGRAHLWELSLAVGVVCSNASP